MMMMRCDIKNIVEKLNAKILDKRWKLDQLKQLKKHKMHLRRIEDQIIIYLY